MLSGVSGGLQTQKMRGVCFGRGFLTFLALGYEVLEVLQNSFFFLFLFLSVRQALVHALCPAKKPSALM